MWYIIVGCFLFTACAGESLYTDTHDVRIRRQNHQQQPQQAQLQQISYRPYNEAPDRIKQLLQVQQAREPLVHLPAQAPPQLQAARGPAGHRAAPPQQLPAAQPLQYNPQVQYGQAPQQPTYKGIQAAPQLGPQAQNNYAPQYKSQYNPQQQPSPNAIYRPLAAGPPAGVGQYQPQQPASQYPKNLPPHIQKIIDSQRQYQG